MMCPVFTRTNVTVKFWIFGGRNQDGGTTEVLWERTLLLYSFASCTFKHRSKEPPWGSKEYSLYMSLVAPICRDTQKPELNPSSTVNVSADMWRTLNKWKQRDAFSNVTKYDIILNSTMIIWWQNVHTEWYYCLFLLNTSHFLISYRERHNAGVKRTCLTQVWELWSELRPSLVLCLLLQLQLSKGKWKMSLKTVRSHKFSGKSLVAHGGKSCRHTKYIASLMISLIEVNNYVEENWLCGTEIKIVCLHMIENDLFGLTCAFTIVFG